MENLLSDAQCEILRLRHENQILSAQVFVIETFAKALDYRAPSQGASPDVAWALGKKIDELVGERDAKGFKGRDE